MYVNNIGIQHTLRRDLMSDSLELVTVEIKSSKTRPIVVVVVWYRPKDLGTDKFDVFANVLQQIESERKECTGDSITAGLAYKKVIRMMFVVILIFTK